MSQIPSNFTDGVFTITDGAAHSATLLLSNGDLAVTGIRPDGRATTKSESRGALVGLRKSARAYPQITVSAILACPLGDFEKQALGILGGFVSTSADIGDVPTNDFDFSFDYNAESRDITGDDLELLSLDYNEGDNSTISFTFEINGPMAVDGTTVITSR
jgi:hypothetical protein